MASLRDESIFLRICKDTGLSESKVREAVSHQKKYASEVMASDEYDTIRLDYLGKLIPNKNRQARIEKIVKEKKRQQQNGSSSR